MKVKVKTFATFRDFLDKEFTAELPYDSEIADLLDRLIMRNPDFKDAIFESEGSLRKFVNILKSGRNIEFLKGLHTKINDGDIIALFPPAGGG